MKLVSHRSVLRQGEHSILPSLCLPEAPTYLGRNVGVIFHCPISGRTLHRDTLLQRTSHQGLANMS